MPHSFHCNLTLIILFIYTNMIKVIIQTSLGRALIYTSGHIVIAMSVVSILTGVSLFEAGLVALIEPTINGAWYYVLDKLWTRKNIQEEISR